MFENFHTELHYMIGGDRLANICVYHDFDWAQVFGHNRATFPNGKCLAKLVREDCPQGKTPALVLTTHDDVKVDFIETDTHYALVVNITDYLINTRYDPSATYLAKINKIPLTKGSLLKNVMSHPELITQIIDRGLTIEMIKVWAMAETDRWTQLQKLVESKNIALEHEEPKEQAPVSLDNVINALQYLAKLDNTEPLMAKLAELGANDLNTITSVAGIVNLRRILDTWENEKKNSSEEFWQGVFTSDSWIISQVFSYPVVIIKDKAYVGGKTIGNVDGNIVDFLYANQITNNVVLVEIKTPTTKLLSAQYRNVFSISTDLSGAINQTLNYRGEIEKNFHALFSGSENKYQVINPRCLLIVGSRENEQLDKIQMKSFEIFRSDLKSVEVITFDELFAKIRLLLSLIEK